MNKKDIIQIIKNVEPQINKDIFNDYNNKSANNDNGIGCNQFRELADICNSAECYEEIELLVKYNEAKDRPKPKKKDKIFEHGKSWDCLMMDGKTTFAGIVISCMEKIKAQSDENNCLKNLSLFFGYFYWNARIWAAENSMTNTKKSYPNNNKKRGN